MAKEDLNETVSRTLSGVDRSEDGQLMRSDQVTSLVLDIFKEIRKLQREHRVEVALKDAFAERIEQLEKRVAFLLHVLSFYGDSQSWWIHVSDGKVVTGPAIQDAGSKARLAQSEVGK